MVGKLNVTGFAPNTRGFDGEFQRPDHDSSTMAEQTGSISDPLVASQGRGQTRTHPHTQKGAQTFLTHRMHMVDSATLYMCSSAISSPHILVFCLHCVVLLLLANSVSFHRHLTTQDLALTFLSHNSTSSRFTPLGTLTVLSHTNVSHVSHAT